MADLALALNGIVVPVLRPASCSPLYGDFAHGVAVTRTRVLDADRFAIVIRSEGGDTMVALLDDDDLDAFANDLAEEVNAAREEGTSSFGLPA